MNPKKLYILNPHRDDFIWEPLYYRFLKRKPLKKYNYLADIFTEGKQIELIASDNCSGIIPEKLLHIFPVFARKLIISFELKQWTKLNAIDSEYKIRWLDKLNPKPEDNIFFFQLYNLRYANRIFQYLNKFNKSFVHLSHYYLNTIEVSKQLHKISNIVLCGDSDVSSHPFFQKYFPWYQQEFLLSPFYINERFQCKVPFEQKLDKIISTGTFHPIEEYPQFSFLVKDWQADSFHINRRTLYDQQENNKHAITCLNSPWAAPSSSWWKKIFQSKKVSQKKYFSIDIVEAYNQHKFAIVGEEICGFPGIGTFEAMACGCINFINPNTVKGILETDEFYIPFTQKISTLNPLDYNFANNQEKSNRGIQFVQTFLSRSACVSRFMKNFIN